MLHGFSNACKAYRVYIKLMGLLCVHTQIYLNTFERVKTEVQSKQLLVKVFIDSFENMQHTVARYM